ncbi:choice-of-anchor J domain-containing protein [Flavobacterium sp.]|uniref:choice-of-anchor J domain-containing protein n=1 Tax=Flavobacterium sp. TaxID=239 RepID=UPI00262F28FD|nr:choice-of-anchor J domain-containing protein [Flavobacterium sp.]
MKKISLYSFVLLAVLAFTACTQDSDVENKQTKTTLFIENFTDNTDGTTLDTPGWTNYAQIGTYKFTEEVFKGDGYAQFTAFQSQANLRQDLNVAWLISPAFDMDKQEGETLVFQSAHAFLSSADNTLELMVSTDYDGNIANFNQSSWVSIPAKTPTVFNDFYEYVNSGAIDLSGFKGTLHFAFKYKGSGVNQNLDCTYQIDNIRLYY